MNVTGSSSVRDEKRRGRGRKTKSKHNKINNFFFIIIAPASRSFSGGEYSQFHLQRFEKAEEIEKRMELYVFMYYEESDELIRNL